MGYLLAVLMTCVCAYLYHGKRHAERSLREANSLMRETRLELHAERAHTVRLRGLYYDLASESKGTADAND